MADVDTWIRWERSTVDVRENSLFYPSAGAEDSDPRSTAVFKCLFTAHVHLSV